MLAGLVPGVFGDRHKLLRQRAGDRTSAGQRLQLPRLRSLGIIALVSLKRTNERPLFSFRSQPGVNARKISFRARLRHHRQKFLCVATFMSDKENIEVGPVSDFASAKFSHRDNSQLVAAENFIHANQTGFCQCRLLPAHCREIGQTENVA